MLKRNLLILPFFILLGFFTAGCPAPCDVKDEEAPAIYADAAPVREALENYRTQRGAYPRVLEELKPEYLNQIPEKFGGRRFTYHRHSEKEYTLRIASRSGGTYSGSCTYQEIEKLRSRHRQTN